VKHRGFAHYAAPIAFLAAVTIVVLIVHSALGNGTHRGPATTTTTETQTTGPGRHHRAAHGHARTYTVQSGDTLESIAQKTGTTVARLEQLNPGVNPSALQVGQKIRVR
jgi:LysM repeat protein